MVKKTFKKEASELIVSVTADKNIWKEEQTKAEKKLLANVLVKGFRKGKVPIDIAKKSISQTDIFSKATQGILNTLAKKSRAVIKDELIISDPTYNIQKISDVDLEINFVYPLYPEIETPNYKNLGVKLEAIKEDKTLVGSELKKLQEQHTLLKDKDEIKKGYIVNFDFKGFVDGKVFDGGKGKKFDLKIGSNTFIPGFEEQMIGLKKGENTEIKVTFSKDYHSKNLRNKKAVFKIIINNIQEKILPQLNDKFVKEANIPDVETLEELKAYMNNVFKQQKKQQARVEFQKKIFAKIKEKTQIIIPTQLLVKEMKIIAQQFEENLQKQSLDKNKYLKMSGIDQITLDSQFKMQAEDRLKDFLIFAEIAKIEKIQLTNEDYEKEYKKLSKVYSQTEKTTKDMISKEQMQIPMTNDRVIDVLIKYNK